MITFIKRKDLTETSPYNMGSLSGNITPNINNGNRQYLTATGNITILEPINGNNYDFMELWVTTNSGNLTLDISGITTPTQSGLVFPITLEDSKSKKLKFEKIFNQWNLVTVIGDY